MEAQKEGWVVTGKGEGEGREEGARKGEQGRGRGEQPKLYLICVVTFDPFLVPTRGFP